MKKKIKIALVGLLMLANIFYFLFVIDDRRLNHLKVAFLDVGQGDAILVEAPNGNQILIDTGPDDSVIRQLSEQLSFVDKKIDLVLTTHPDLDHIGGAPTLLERFAVENYAFYKNSAQSPLTAKISEITERNQTNTRYLKAGDKIILDNTAEIYAEILWPSEKFSTEDKNDLSIVVKIVYGDVSILLTGDASSEIEKLVTEEFGENVRANILKLGHHGSKTSTSQEFLDAVLPEIVVVSAGLDNKFGHPAEEVVQRVTNFGISGDKILKTTGGGSVVLYSDGQKIWSD